MKYIVVEVTEEEESIIKNNDKDRMEILNRRYCSSKIPISINEIDIDAWAEAFSIAAPHDEAIFSLFYFYEDYKAEMRCD